MLPPPAAKEVVDGSAEVPRVGAAEPEPVVLAETALSGASVAEVAVGGGPGGGLEGQNSLVPF